MANLVFISVSLICRPLWPDYSGIYKLKLVRKKLITERKHHSRSNTYMWNQRSVVANVVAYIIFLFIAFTRQKNWTFYSELFM